MARRCNVAILVAIFASSWISAECHGVPVTADRIARLVMIPLTAAASLPLFFGTVHVLFSAKRGLKRPGIDQFPWARNSPLQFLWFAGRFFCVAGVGHFLGCFRSGISSDAVTILTAGMGLVVGSGAVQKVFSRRFARE